jgi:hypothetical protein
MWIHLAYPTCLKIKCLVIVVVVIKGVLWIE